MSPVLELLQALLLSTSAATSAVCIGRARRHYGDADQPALFCALLGFALAAGSGVCLLASQLDFDAGEAQRWLERATLLLGLPLIALAALTLGRSWAWSRPTWGRVLLGLCAFFELARQLGWSAPYALGLVLGSALLVTYAGFLQWPQRRPTMLAALAGALLLACTPLEFGGAGSSPLSDYRPLLLALASPLLVWLLLDLPGNARIDRDASA